MEVISKEAYSVRDHDSLCAFFQYCKKIAIEKGQSQTASICLEIKHLDPLAVLKSIYKSDNLSFYFEHPASDFAIAGAEAVVQAEFSGLERFRKVSDFSRKVLENTIVTGNLDLPFSGPHFFTSFTFYDGLAKKSAFSPAQVFLPFWQLARSGSVCSLVINTLVSFEDSTVILADKVLAAYQKFNSSDYCELSLTPENRIVKSVEVGGPGWHENAVGAAKSCIEGGEFEKIVIARALDIEGDKPFDPLGSLSHLRRAFPLCFSCFVSNGQGQSFSSVAPERLLKVEKGRVQTEALAGSTSRGISLEEDERLGALLLESDKDLHEHKLVVDSIVDRLHSLDINAEFENKPLLKKLANVQHLHTPIEAKVPQNLHLLEIAAALHPTPAVCGIPLEASRRAISKIENFDRGLYAGVIGWFDNKGNGELVVGLRSALIDGNKARLYSGGGIVKGSDPASELRETDIKLQAMLQNLR